MALDPVLGPAIAVIDAWSIYMWVFGLLNTKVEDHSKKLETLAEDTYNSVQDIVVLLENLDAQLAFEDSRLSMKIELESLNLLYVFNEDPSSQEWKNWASQVVESIGGDTSHGALDILHELMATDDEDNIIEIFRKKTKKIIDSDLIHTETLTRRVMEFFLSLQTWQALNYQLLFQANEYLYGPSGNNFDYKAMIARTHKEHEKFNKILEDIDDSNNFVERLDANLDEDSIEEELWVPYTAYVHLEKIVAEPEHVVIGFQLIKLEKTFCSLKDKNGKCKDYDDDKTIRLAIRIKQGVLNEMGRISKAEKEWIEPTNFKRENREGKDYVLFFKYVKNEAHYNYVDLSFIEAGPGKAIVGITFCKSGNRLALCVKTMEVDFLTGDLNNGEWTDPPWGKDYLTLSKEGQRRVSGQIVETNPPAMITGVGLTIKENTKNHESFAIRAKDVFKFVPNGKSCNDGDFSNFVLGIEDDGNLDCCDGFAYNKTIQVCTGDGKGPYYRGTN